MSENQSQEQIAKQLVIERAARIQERLENETQNPMIWGEAFQILLEMLMPLYLASLVSEEECKLFRDELKQQDEANTSFQWGPFQTKHLSISLGFGFFLIFVYAVLKSKGWIG